ncbi:MAG: insulinase family protein [Acidobacteria bacterium]|nr:insulinase family protein [Acidobacteriota bacterium]
MRKRTLFSWPILFWFLPPLLAQTAGDPLPKIVRRQLLNGLQVLVSELPQQPKVTLHLMIKSGATYDPVAKAGLSDLTARLLTRGTVARTEGKIANELQGLGARLESYSDWDATHVIARAPGEHLLRIVEVMADVLLNPSFTQEDFDALKREVSDRLRAERDTGPAKAHLQFQRILFQGAPYVRPLQGTPETLESVSLGDVKLFYQRFFVPNNSVLVVAGSVPGEEVITKVARRFGVWVKRPVVPFTFAPAEPPTGVKVFLTEAVEDQRSFVEMGSLAVRRNDRLAIVFQILHEVVSGELPARLSEDEPRAFLELRRLPSSFSVRFSALTDQVTQGIQSVLQMWRDLAVSGVSQEKFRSAKERVLDRFRFGTSDELADRILEVELYELGFNYWSSFRKAVESVTLEDLKQAVNEYLTRDLVVAVSGKGETLKASLEKVGPVRQ